MKRIISLLLSLLMLFSALAAVSSSVYAADEPVKFELNVTKKYMATNTYFRLKPTATSGKIKKVEYESANMNIAYPDEEGYIYAATLGETTITVTVNGKYKKKCKIRVNKCYTVVLNGGSHKYPRINGKKTKNWKTNNKNRVQAKKKVYKGVANKKRATLTKKVGKRTYKLYVYSVNRSELLKIMKKESPDMFKHKGKVITQYICIERLPKVYLGYGGLTDNAIMVTYDISPKIEYDGYHWTTDSVTEYFFYDAKGLHSCNGHRY